MPLSTRPAIFFRCDGGRVDGMGHVMQSLVLAEAFRRQAFHDISFVTFSPDQVARQKIEHYGFSVQNAGGPAGSRADLEGLVRLLTAQSNEDTRPIVITDNHTISAAYLRECCTRSFLVCIDEQAAHELPCQVLVNYHLSASADRYQPNPPERLLLLGPEYNLLREEFFDCPVHGSSSRTKDGRQRLHILITMGGEDPYNHSSWLIHTLKDILQNHDVTVIVGAAHPEKQRVQEDVTRLVPQGSCVHNTQEMARYMRTADLCITAGGITCYELAAMRVPQLAIVLEQHQWPLVRSLEQRGCLAVLGWHAELEPEAVSRAVTRLIASGARRAEMASAAAGLFQCPGAPNIVSAIRGRFSAGGADAD